MQEEPYRVIGSLTAGAGELDISNARDSDDSHATLRFVMYGSISSSQGTMSSTLFISSIPGGYCYFISNTKSSTANTTAFVQVKPVLGS